MATKNKIFKRDKHVNTNLSNLRINDIIYDTDNSNNNNNNSGNTK